MSLLEFKNKFSIENPKKAANIPESGFFKWTNQNFYRTSYNDMTVPVSNNESTCSRSQLKTKTSLFLAIKATCLELLPIINMAEQSPKPRERFSSQQSSMKSSKCLLQLGKNLFYQLTNGL